MPKDRMLSVEQAFARIVSQFGALEVETVPLPDALGRVLAEDVVSAEDVPAFDNSAMDGYAVRFADTQAASESQPTKLNVVGDLAAGAVPAEPLGSGEAVRIMTGAPVPPGSDAVVPFEDTDRTDWAKFGTPPGASGDPAVVGILLPPEHYDNVRFRGEDIKTGETVLARGQRVRPAEVGVLASLGKTRATVYRRPVVAVIPTGDEVIEIDQPLGPGQVRNSAAHALEALVVRYGGIPRRLPVVGDTVAATRAALLSCLDCDLIVTIGGVSMGDYDLVRNVLGAEGEIDFWRIRMRPGKPLAFGHIEAAQSSPSPQPSPPGEGAKPAHSDSSPSPWGEGRGEGENAAQSPTHPSPNAPRRVPVVGLPGNPVSAYVTFEEFVRPALLVMQGDERLHKTTVSARFLDSMENHGRRQFVRVIVERDDHGYTARLTGEQGSQLLTSLARANGLAVISEHVEYVEPGSSVTVQMLDWPEER